jgi:hypothetical protein
MHNIKIGRIDCEDMPIILAGDFNVNVKDNCNVELVEFRKVTFKFDALTDVSRGMTRFNPYTDMVFGRNVNNLSCMNYISYFRYHTSRPVLRTINLKLLNSLT